MDLIITVEVHQKKNGGDWSIKGKDSAGQTWSSAGTIFANRERLTEGQAKCLTSYLVHYADKWMKGTRDYADPAEVLTPHGIIEELAKRVEDLEGLVLNPRADCMLQQEMGGILLWYEGDPILCADMGEVIERVKELDDG